jgi:hypothetical protein
MTAKKPPQPGAKPRRDYTYRPKPLGTPAAPAKAPAPRTRPAAPPPPAPPPGPPQPTALESAILRAVADGACSLEDLAERIKAVTRPAIIDRVHALRRRGLLTADQAEALTLRRSVAVRAPADPVRVARHWLRQGADWAAIAGHLAASCPRPGGWSAEQAEGLGAQDHIDLRDLRKIGAVSVLGEAQKRSAR